MNYRMMGKFISRILMVEAVFMLPALMISVYRQEKETIFGFLTGIVITLVTALFYICCAERRERAFMPERGLSVWGRAGL